MAQAFGFYGVFRNAGNTGSIFRFRKASEKSKDRPETSFIMNNAGQHGRLVHRRRPQRPDRQDAGQ